MHSTKSSRKATLVNSSLTIKDSGKQLNYCCEHFVGSFEWLLYFLFYVDDKKENLSLKSVARCLVLMVDERKSKYVIFFLN